MKITTSAVTIQVTTHEMLQNLVASLEDVISDTGGEISFEHYFLLMDALVLGREDVLQTAFRDGHIHMLLPTLDETLAEYEDKGIPVQVEILHKDSRQQTKSISISSNDICM